MSITDRYEAVDSFVRLLRRTAACVTEVPLIAQPASPDLFHIALVDNIPVDVQTESGYPNLKFSIVHDCRPVPHPDVAGAYTVSSAYYAYAVHDLEEAEILTYHWHPAGESPVTFPHLHLPSQIGPISVASLGREPAEMHLANLHIPTGRVLLEDVVRVLIEEFNVRPLTQSWENTLALNAEIFREIQRW